MGLNHSLEPQVLVDQFAPDGDDWFGFFYRSLGKVLRRLAAELGQKAAGCRFYFPASQIMKALKSSKLSPLVMDEAGFFYGRFIKFYVSGCDILSQLVFYFGEIGIFASGFLALFPHEIRNP